MLFHLKGGLFSKSNKFRQTGLMNQVMVARSTRKCQECKSFYLFVLFGEFSVYVFSYAENNMV